VPTAPRAVAALRAWLRSAGLAVAPGWSVLGGSRAALARTLRAWGVPVPAAGSAPGAVGALFVVDARGTLRWAGPAALPAALPDGAALRASLVALLAADVAGAS
jgi:hypothetical protein